MPVSLTTLTGPIYMPNGATPIGGRVSFELSSWDREEGEALVVSGPTYSNIDENGQFSVELFTTTEGVNTVNYRMYVLWEDSTLSQSYVNDVYVSSPAPHYTKKYIGSFALSGPGPFRVSDLNIMSELELNSFDVLLECQAYALAAKVNVEEVSTALNVLVVDANNAADLSQAWAESPTSPDGGPSSKSSKIWASEAADSASAAADSAAIMPALVEGEVAFRRKLAIALPWTTATARGFTASSGAELYYPQSFCFDDTGNRLFMLTGPVGGTISSYDVLIIAFDISDRNSPAVLSTFRLQTGASREYLIHRRIGGAEYLYAGGDTNPKRFDITIMPADGSTVAAETTYTNVQNYSHAAFDGRSWAFQTGLVDNGAGGRSKAQLHVWDADLTEILAEYWLPRQIASTYINPMLDALAKSQSMCWHGGKIWTAVGGAYEAGALSGELDSRLQGIISFDPIGDTAEAFVAPAPTARLRFAECFGIGEDNMPVIETEGITSHGGKLYALWSTLNGTIWHTAAALSRGIYITEEISAHPTATDFSDLASIPRAAGFNPEAASYYGWSADQDGQIKHPLTGAPLLTVKAIADAMIDCAMTSVRVYTTGISPSLIDPDGDDVGSGVFVNIYHMRGWGCNVEVRALNAWKRWWYAVGTFYRDQIGRSSTGDLLMNFDEPNVTSKTSGSILHTYGRGSFITENTHALELQRTGSVGYLAAFFNTARNLIAGIYQRDSNVEYRFSGSAWFSGGAGNPEGVIAGPKGSVWSRTDGGAGTTLYVKESGTGVTGWVAK